MAKHNKTGEALEKYRAKQRAKKIRNGQKERRLKKRVEARASAIEQYEATLEQLKKAQSAHAEALKRAAEDATNEGDATEAGHTVLDAQYGLDALASAYEHALRSRELAAAREQKAVA